jgi:BirA family transcriptional regulator, biotin operon repressor / biotin---[acetyl-CoA-carboxylase] ligase
LSHPSYNRRIGEPFIELFTIDSTNNYAMARVHEGLANHGMVVITAHQTAGKGQRNKGWTANAGENITISCVLEPNGPNSTRPFLLSAAVALACRDFFNDYTRGDTSIKWPNDIYWRDRKAGGILIENIYRASQWQFAIAGIGLNLNQASFPDDLPNPVSLKQITGREHNRVELAKELCERLDQRYRQFLQEDNQLMEEYNQHLYRRGENVKFKKDNIVFQANVIGVSPLGQLITKDAIEKRFDFGEIEWYRG